jgi:hypothetical protein
MQKIIIKNWSTGKKVATYKGNLTLDELNAVIHGKEPNKYSLAEKLYGRGALC